MADDSFPQPFPHTAADGYIVDYLGGLWIWEESKHQWKQITSGGSTYVDEVVEFANVAAFPPTVRRTLVVPVLPLPRLLISILAFLLAIM